MSLVAGDLVEQVGMRVSAQSSQIRLWFGPPHGLRNVVATCALAIDRHCFQLDPDAT